MEDQEQLAEKLFGEALELPPDERSAYLSSACNGSQLIRARVDQLLSDYARLGTFLDAPAVNVSHPLPTTGVANASVRTFGRYTLIEPLGSGGMGSVYRARDEKLQREVAIKLVSPGVLSDEEARRRFSREALALAKLSHAAIASVYDVGEQDGTDFIVMECVQGQTLAALLADGPIPVRQATAIALEIAHALEEAHEHGVIHRDLKPANVMITPRGHVKVLDFGVAKLLAASSSDMTLSVAEPSLLLGTPRYMSPEQAQGRQVDGRSDLFSLGVLYYECLTGTPPFRGDSNLALLHAIVSRRPEPLRRLRPDAPLAAEDLTNRLLAKDPAQRYQTAAQAALQLSEIASTFSGSVALIPLARERSLRTGLLVLILAFIVTLIAGTSLYRRSVRRQWASDEAIPQINTLIDERHPVAAMLLLQKAQGYLPEDSRLIELEASSTQPVHLTSSPTGALVEVQDYNTPNGPWYRAGVTPIESARLPKGQLRWRISRSGLSPMVVAPRTLADMDFSLDAWNQVPSGMVPVAGGLFHDDIGFVGWIGPYTLPAYAVDRFEVTNRDFQRFVDGGGYTRPEYWKNRFNDGARELSWSEAMDRFRDTTGRTGPSHWQAGHFPEGQAEYPVSGVSWYEASAYAAWAGKELPSLAQFFQVAPASASSYTIPASNISASALAPVGSFHGLGPYGTYDTAGNVREWIQNPVDHDLRFILGGSWRSPAYLYFDPEALSAWDRSDENGFRCVRNTTPLPPEVTGEITRQFRDFAHFKPASDDVFRAYEAMYYYARTPLNVEQGGIVAETADWTEEKVTFDAAYRGERMAAYLFLPKKVLPPYQAVIFFPSARVEFLPGNDNGRQLGDVKFFDYVVQSGRAVIYPIYQDTYERRHRGSFPGGAQDIQLTTDWYKDVARSLDYLASRPDIDPAHVAYLGVSMGSAEGIIASALLGERLKTTILLDGGFFQENPPPGGDQADFAVHIHQPFLMVNGRYDFVFSLDAAQDPLFHLVATPEKDKRHVILESPHDVTEQKPQLVHEVLTWLDKYLGRVSGSDSAPSSRASQQ